jgi:hypothetical protein
MLVMALRRTTRYPRHTHAFWIFVSTRQKH